MAQARAAREARRGRAGPGRQGKARQGRARWAPRNSRRSRRRHRHRCRHRRSPRPRPAQVAQPGPGLAREGGRPPPNKAGGGRPLLPPPPPGDGSGWPLGGRERPGSVGEQPAGLGPGGASGSLAGREGGGALGPGGACPAGQGRGLVVGVRQGLQWMAARASPGRGGGDKS